MKNLSTTECIDRIKAIKKNWRRTFIKIVNYQQWPSQCYRLINFTYKGVKYEYRESASNSWISIEA